MSKLANNGSKPSTFDWDNTDEASHIHLLTIYNILGARLLCAGSEEQKQPVAD